MQASTRGRHGKEEDGEMKMQPQIPIDWRARCNLARSVLDQREPSWLTVHVAHMALNGLGIDQIRAEESRLAAMEDGAA